VIVEDRPLQLALLCAAVEAASNATVTARCASGDDLRRLLATADAQAPDLLLLDLHLPDGSGLDLLPEARRRWPDLAVLVVSSLNDERSVIEAIRRGASGFLVKSSDRPALTTAIEEALAGSCPVSPSIARHLIRELRRPETAGEAPADAETTHLTSRESQVLHCMAAGQSYAEAAADLGVTVSTVEAHIRNLYRKLEAHSKVQAVLSARKRGLLR
jgi:DNA-binding NarL/FixJ family response regulator